MKTNITNFTIASLLSALLASSAAYAIETSSEDNKFYFGVEGGYSVPAKHKFKEKVDGNDVIGKLKGTEVYEGKVGYKVYPGLALELAYAYRPQYKLTVYFPDKPDVFAAFGGGGMTNMNGTAKVASHTIMLNMMYEAQSETAYRPYFLFGLGYARVTPKKSPIYTNIPAALAPALNNGNNRMQIGNIKKFTSERLGWRIGGGMVYDINPHFSLVGGVKLEVINKIGLHTEFFDPQTKQLAKRSSLKKTIGVVDFTLGARFSL